MVTRLSNKEIYLQNIYFLLHDHNPTTILSVHNHELLGLNAYKYEPLSNSMLDVMYPKN